ncbi:MAG: GNAT family N-acetyltransferase [Clostridiales bacterium]|nr:GNAT family N-acetyltransferase [Clostridiales bacterium]
MNDLTIQKVDKDTKLQKELISFIENCSWIETKEHLAKLIRDWKFTDWETMFVAKTDGRIIGMASVLKEDYYPTHDIFPWVSSIFVSEEYRGQRISGKLIEAANIYLKDQGFTKSYIPSEHVGLYEHYGYQYVRDITNYGGSEDHLYEKVFSIV